MKNKRNFQILIIAVGSLLLILRLLFPVKDYFVYQSNIRVKVSSLDSRIFEMAEKTIDLPRTIFHSLGILVLSSSCFLIVRLRYLSETEPIVKYIQREYSEWQYFPEYWRVVKIIYMRYTSSFGDFVGDYRFPGNERYKDPTPQLAVLYQDEETKMTLPHRYDLKGYLNYSEEVHKDKYQNVQGWACTMQGKDFYRVEDSQKTEKVREELNKLLDILSFHGALESDLRNFQWAFDINKSHLQIKVEAMKVIDHPCTYYDIKGYRKIRYSNLDGLM